MKRGWVIALGLGAVAVILLAALSSWRSGAGSGVEGHVEVRPDARTSDEVKVKADLLDRHAAAISLEVFEWGPHDSVMALRLTWPRPSQKSDTARTDPHPEPRPAKVIRVHYVLQNQMGTRRKADELYFLQDGKVVGHVENLYGNAWKERYAAEER